MKDPALKAAVLADYIAGMSSTSAALKHGVSPSTACGWVHRAGISRSHSKARQNAKERREAEFALTGGRWVPNSRGIQVWRAA